MGERHSEQLNFGGSSAGCSKKPSNINTLKKSSVLTFPQLTLETIRRNKNLLYYSNIKKIIHKKLPAHCNSRAVVRNHRLQQQWKKNFGQLNFVHIFSIFPSHTVDTHTPEATGRFGRNQLGVRLTPGSPGEI